MRIFGLRVNIRKTQGSKFKSGKDLGISELFPNGNIHGLDQRVVKRVARLAPTMRAHCGARVRGRRGRRVHSGPHRSLADGEEAA
jgi:hypothetical protein